MHTQTIIAQLVFFVVLYRFEALALELYDYGHLVSCTS